MASITETALSQDELLELLLKKLAMDEDSYVKTFHNNASGAVPGICIEPDCHGISHDCEPDASDMDCEHCDAHATVRSGFILMG